MHADWPPEDWQDIPEEIMLKTDRGTILFADLIYNDANGQRSNITLNIIDNQIGSITPLTFFDENDIRKNFGVVDIALDGATIIQAELRIVYPDGQFKITSPLAFNGDIALIGWTQGKFDAGFIATMADWDNNPAYVTIRPHDASSI